MNTTMQGDRPRRHTLALLLAGATSYLTAANPLAWYQHLRQLRAEGRLPGLDQHGVIIPRQMLQDRLQETLADEPDIRLESLRLTPEHGTLVLVHRKLVDVQWELQFKVEAVDWSQRSIFVAFQETTRAASPHLLGRLLGSVVITAFEAAVGKDHLQRSAGDRPYMVITGNRMQLMLDKMPALQEKLNLVIGGYRVFDHVGIHAITTETDQLRVKLALRW